MEDKYTGKRLDGRYEMHELVGTGGMAYVYKAYDRQTENWVAVKILKEEFSDNKDFLRRFRNESRAIAMLSHDNIVKVYDVSFGDKLQYIVMEYISGITLKDYITRKGALPWKDTVYFTMQILTALEHAHQNGIIHRDIKPQNIILLRDGKIKVTDFGIARFSQSETQTMTDKALGSVHYIAPEQAKGEYTSDKVDIYSLGVMMYEMLTGQLPFEADNPVSVAIMQLQAKAQRPRLIKPDIPEALEEITLKAMEKNPAMRFRNANEMLRDFDEFRKNPNIVFNYNDTFSNDETKQMDIVSVSDEKVQSNEKDEYLDNYEYEEELVKSKKHAMGSMIITGIIAALLVVIVSIGAYMVYQVITTPAVEENDEILLPNFLTMNYFTGIEDNSLYNDFNFKIDFITNADKEVGAIVSQKPSGGLMVKKGSEVTIIVVKEPDQAEIKQVPDVSGDSVTDAFNTIQEAGFTPEISYANSNTAANYVIRTEPMAGYEAEVESTVVIYVSRGPSTVQTYVPSLVGETLEYSKLLLEEANLTWEIVYDDKSKEPRDIVVKISPEAGDRIAEKSKVKITVSSGSQIEKTVNASFPLPTSVNEDVSLKIYVDGSLVESSMVNPSMAGSFTTSFVDKNGSKSIIVRLNNKDYIYATAEFDSANGSFSISSTLPFVPDTES